MPHALPVDKHFEVMAPTHRSDPNVPFPRDVIHERAALILLVNVQLLVVACQCYESTRTVLTEVLVGKRFEVMAPNHRSYPNTYLCGP